MTSNFSPIGYTLLIGATGIDPRRNLRRANRSLSAILTLALGSTDWLTYIRYRLMS